MAAGRPHSHWSGVHLRRGTSALKPPGRLALSEIAPPFGLCKPLATVLRIFLRALQTHQFHGAGVYFVHYVASPLVLMETMFLLEGGKDKAIDVLMLSFAIR
jgi:hypothetical protein